MLQQTQAARHVYRTTDWRRNTGEIVELRRMGDVYRRGVVDAAMDNGSGLWLAADGPNFRVYVHNDDDLELWVECTS